MHGTNCQLAIGSGTGTGVTERTGQKVIFTGHRSEVVSRLKVQKSASGSDLQSPESLGKSQIVGAGLLQDVPGRPCSQLVKVTLPSLTVKKGRFPSHTVVTRLSYEFSAPRLHVSLIKEQDPFMAEIIKASCAFVQGCSNCIWSSDTTFCIESFFSIRVVHIIEG